MGDVMSRWWYGVAGGVHLGRSWRVWKERRGKTKTGSEGYQEKRVYYVAAGQVLVGPVASVAHRGLKRNNTQMHERETI
jgi:hypothetical protein